MAIVNVRVDERLVHGQVANIWTPMLKVDRIVVVDEAILNNQVEKMSLKLATPGGVSLSVISIEKAIKNFTENKYGEQRVLLLVRKISTIESLSEAIVMEGINIANLGKREGYYKLMNSVYVDQNDILSLLRLYEKGLKLYSQMVPNNPSTDIIEIVKEIQERI